MLKNNKDIKKWTVLIIRTRILHNNQAIILNLVNYINRLKSNKFSVMKKIANQVYFTQTKNKIAVVKKYLINTINWRIETISHF